VRIPQDEAPHHDETEWWYFSGHLRGFDIFGKPHSYGYELVFFSSIFRTRLNRFIKPTWTSPILPAAISIGT